MRTKILVSLFLSVLFTGCALTTNSKENNLNKQEIQTLIKNNNSELLKSSIQEKKADKKDYFYIYPSQTLSSTLKELSALEGNYYFLRGKDFEIPATQNLKIHNFKELNEIVSTLSGYEIKITKNKFRSDLPKVVEVKEQKKETVLDRVRFEALSLNIPSKLFLEIGKHADGWKIVGAFDIQDKINTQQYVNFRGTLREFLEYYAVTKNLFIDYDYGIKTITFSKYKIKHYPLKVVQETYSYDNKLSTDIEFENEDGGTKNTNGSIAIKNDFDFYKSLQELLDKVISKEDNNEYWDFIKATNQLVVKTTRDKLENIEKVVTNINATSFQQLSISVQAYEVTLDKNFEYGINWGYISNSLNRSLTIGTSSLVPTLDNTLSQPQVIKLSASEGITSTLNLMNKFGTIKVGNSTTVITTNNVPAIYSIADRTGYVSNYSLNTTDGSSTSSLSIEQKKAVGGQHVYIKPTIFNDEILLNLKMILARVNDIVKQDFSNGQYIQTPIDTRKNYSQNIVLRDGEQIIIGGIVNNADTKGYEGASPDETSMFSALAGVDSKSNSKKEIVLIIKVKKIK
jgi:hypothetical protein